MRGGDERLVRAAPAVLRRPEVVPEAREGHVARVPPACPSLGEPFGERANGFPRAREAVSRAAKRLGKRRQGGSGAPARFRGDTTCPFFAGIFEEYSPEGDTVCPGMGSKLAGSQPKIGSIGVCACGKESIDRESGSRRTFYLIHGAITGCPVLWGDFGAACPGGIFSVGRCFSRPGEVPAPNRIGLEKAIQTRSTS